MTRNIIIILSIFGMISCHSADEKKTHKMDISGTAGVTGVPKPDLKSLHFDYLKDPACGMPLRAGLEDTAHYKGELYGFCSKECKDEFLKNPASYIAQIK